MNAFFDLKDLTYVYEDGTTALKNLNLQINRGKKIALLGSNGAGKSTFFLHLNGLLKPTSGSIYFEGEKLHYSRKQLVHLRTKVGIVFQNPETQLFNGTVREDISFGPMNLNISDLDRNEQIAKAISLTEVEDLLDKPIHFLSIGQKKRVSIAGVLAMDPKILILDEPTAALDVFYKNRILNLLNELHTKERTIILSTHDIQFAYEWADEVIVIHNGEILFQGNTVELFENKGLVEEANLGVPWSFEVGKILKKQGHIVDLNRFKSSEKLIELLEEILPSSLIKI